MAANPIAPREIAIVAATQTPYFDHFFQRIETELSVSTRVYLTHSRGTSPGIDAHRFGPGLQRSVSQDWDTSYRARVQEWRFGSRIIRSFRKVPPTLVILMGYNDPCRLRVARWCKAAGIPVFAWSDINARGLQGGGFRDRLKRQYIRWIDRHISAWLLCGSAGRNYLKQFGINEGRTFLVPCEPAYDKIDAVGAQGIASARNQFQFTSSRRRFICSGRMVASKRFDLVIQSFCDIAAQQPEWDLVVMGDGAKNADLKKMVPDDLCARVHFTGFVADPVSVWAVYKACDVLVHLADHEPWGLIVNEAAACGLAMVCSDVVGAAVELVRNGVNGRIIARDDVHAAADAMLDVTDPAKLPGLQAASKQLLDAWRAKADPISGLREAIAFAGVKL